MFFHTLPFPHNRVSNIMVTAQKKSAGTVSLLVPHILAFALPLAVEQATQSPRRYDITSPVQLNNWIPYLVIQLYKSPQGMRIITSLGHPSLPSSLTANWSCEVQMCQRQKRDKRLFICRDSLYNPTQSFYDFSVLQIGVAPSIRLQFTK